MPNVNDQVKFKFGTQESYDRLLESNGLEQGTIYWTTDTRHIYLGSSQYVDIYQGDIDNIVEDYLNLEVSGFYTSQSALYYVLAGSPNELYPLPGNPDLEDYLNKTEDIDTSTLSDSDGKVPSSKLISSLLASKASSSEYYNRTDSDLRYAKLNNDDDLAGAREDLVTVGLTNNNFSNEYKSKLDYLINISLGLNQPKSDFNETDDSKLSYIFNKPLVEGTPYDDLPLPSVEEEGVPKPKANLVSYSTFQDKLGNKLDKIIVEPEEGLPSEDKLVEISCDDPEEVVSQENESERVQLVKYKSVYSNDLGIKLAGDASLRDSTYFSRTSNSKYVADLSGKVVESLNLNGSKVPLGTNGEVNLDCVTSVKVDDNTIPLSSEDSGTIDLSNQFAKTISASTSRGIVKSSLKDEGDIDITNILHSVTNIPVIPNEFSHLQVIDSDVNFIDVEGNDSPLEDDGEIKIVEIDEEKEEEGQSIHVKFDEYVNVEDYQKNSSLTDCTKGSGELSSYYTFSTLSDVELSQYKLNRDVSLEFQYSSELSSPITLDIYPANVFVHLEKLEDSSYNGLYLYWYMYYQVSNYDTTKSYTLDEEVFHNDKLYSCMVYQTKAGQFDKLQWREVTWWDSKYDKYYYTKVNGVYSLNQEISMSSAVSQSGRLYNVIARSIDRFNYHLYIENATSGEKIDPDSPSSTYSPDDLYKIFVRDSNDVDKLSIKFKIPTYPSYKIGRDNDIDLAIIKSLGSYENAPLNSYYYNSISDFTDLYNYSSGKYTLRSVTVEAQGNYVRVEPSTNPPENWSIEYNNVYYTYDSVVDNYVLNNISNWYSALNQKGGLYRKSVNLLEYNPYSSSHFKTYWNNNYSGSPIFLEEISDELYLNHDYYIRLLDLSHQEDDVEYYLPTLEFKLNLSDEIDYTSDQMTQVEVSMYLGDLNTIGHSDFPKQEFIISSVFSNTNYSNNNFDDKSVAVYIESTNSLGLYSEIELNLSTNSFLGNYLEGDNLKDLVKSYILSESLPGTSSLKFIGYYPETDYKYSNINRYTNYVAGFSWSPLKVTINSTENSETCYISSIDSLLNGLPQSYDTKYLVVSEITEGSSQQVELNNLILGHTYKVEYVKEEVLNFAIKIKLPDEIGESCILRIFNSKISSSSTDINLVPDNSYYGNNGVLKDEYYYIPVDHAYGISFESEGSFEEYRNYGNKTFLIDDELLNFKFNLYLVKNFGLKVPPLFELSDDLSSGIPTATTSITRYKNNNQDKRLRFNFEGLYIVPYINNFKERGEE